MRLPVFKWEVLLTDLLSNRMNLTKQEINKLNDSGISESTIQKQFLKLVNGPANLDLKRACVIGDGIEKISVADFDTYQSIYQKGVLKNVISIFTPASGAATRMFKHLLNPESNPDLYGAFIKNLERFAFFHEMERMNKSSIEEKVQFILNPEGLNYAKLPKALISFHKYGNEVLKAIDEQLVEGIAYINSDSKCRFHFTISPEHENLIKTHLAPIIKALEVTHEIEILVEYSFQESYTDTIALQPNGELVRDEMGELLLRPGGHGSLIYNLNGMESNIVFIKNIDNIARKELHPRVIQYKRIIGGYLMDIQTRVFDILRELEVEVSANRLEDMVALFERNWNLKLPSSQDELILALNKPIRVCGMVKNEGKAGGGPFWVGDTPQIVESAQMNTSLPEVKDMLVKASHFNPVDLVCGIKNYKDEKFNLLDFTDDQSFFVSEKSYLGQEIKVLEHPGLWNGAMANWLTFFIEVPVVTFNPVKTVNDLLLPSHCDL